MAGVGKSANLKPVSRDQVIYGRKQFVKGETTVKELSKRWERGIAWVRLALRGKIYPGKTVINVELTRFRRRMTPEQVIEARRAYAAGEMNQEEIAAKYGQINCGNMLFGKTYKDIGEAVTDKRNYRSLSDEEVIEVRRAYAAKEFTQHEIAAKYKLHQKSVSNLLRGLTYKHLEGAVEDSDGKFARKLTDQQVIEARKAFRSRKLTVKSLAEYYGIDRSPMRGILVGRCYKEVPLAVKRITDFAPPRKGRSNRLLHSEAMTPEERSVAKSSVLALIDHYGGTQNTATALGMKIETIQHWRKKGMVSLPQYQKIAEILAVPVEQVRPDLHRPNGKPYYGLPSTSRDEIEMLIAMANDIGSVRVHWSEREDEEAA